MFDLGKVICNSIAVLLILGCIYLCKFLLTLVFDSSSGCTATAIIIGVIIAFSSGSDSVHAPRTWITGKDDLPPPQPPEDEV